MREGRGRPLPLSCLCFLNGVIKIQISIVCAAYASERCEGWWGWAFGSVPLLFEVVDEVDEVRSVPDDVDSPNAPVAAELNHGPPDGAIRRVLDNRVAGLEEKH